MKNYLGLKHFLLITLITAFTFSCSNDDNGSQSSDNIIMVAENANLTSLVSALQRAELVTALEGDGPFTVLAPSNAAFNTFLADNGYATIEDVPIGLLTQVLLNHVISSEIRSNALTSAGSGYSTTLADGPTDGSKLNIYFDARNGVEFNGKAMVSQADVDASNGVVHVVDEVIDLPSIVTFVASDPNFSDLTAALTADGQPNFVSTLSTPNGTSPTPFTVFAPVNDAFSKLTDQPAGALLTAVLQHHVIAENNILSTDITDGLASPATLEGDVLNFAVSGASVTITDGAGNSEATIRTANLQATNGVIHAIETVLIPDTTN